MLLLLLLSFACWVGVLAGLGGVSIFDPLAGQEFRSVFGIYQVFCERDGATCVGLVGGRICTRAMSRKAVCQSEHCFSSAETFCVDLSWRNMCKFSRFIIVSRHSLRERNVMMVVFLKRAIGASSHRAKCI